MYFLLKWIPVCFKIGSVAVYHSDYCERISGRSIINNKFKFACFCVRSLLVHSLHKDEIYEDCSFCCIYVFVAGDHIPTIPIFWEVWCCSLIVTPKFRVKLACLKIVSSRFYKAVKGNFGRIKVPKKKRNHKKHKATRRWKGLAGRNPSFLLQHFPFKHTYITPLPPRWCTRCNPGGILASFNTFVLAVRQLLRRWRWRVN